MRTPFTALTGIAAFAAFLVQLALPMQALAATPVRPAAIALQPASSEISFTSRQMGVPVSGRFQRFDAKLEFDPRRAEAGKVSLAIDLASVSLGAPELEAELAKAVWFDTRKFGQASFVSSTIKSSGAGRFEVGGKLSLKGLSRDIVVPITLAQSGGMSTATGSFVLKRLDFRIGDGEWSDTSMVANEVQVNFKLVFSGAAPL